MKFSCTNERSVNILKRSDESVRNTRTYPEHVHLQYLKILNPLLFQLKLNGSFKLLVSNSLTVNADAFLHFPLHDSGTRIFRWVFYLHGIKHLPVCFLCMKLHSSKFSFPYFVKKTVCYLSLNGFDMFPHDV